MNDANPAAHAASVHLQQGIDPLGFLKDQKLTHSVSYGALAFLQQQLVQQLQAAWDQGQREKRQIQHRGLGSREQAQHVHGLCRVK